MLSMSALRDALALLLKARSEPLLEIDTGTARLPARSVGEVVQARVVAALANGRSVIEIEGAPVDVKLPVPARVGDALRLQVLMVTPRLTFALLAQPGASAASPVVVSESVRRLAAVLDQLSTAAPELKPQGPHAGPALAPRAAGAGAAAHAGAQSASQAAPPVAPGAASADAGAAAHANAQRTSQAGPSPSARASADAPTHGATTGASTSQSPVARAQSAFATVQSPVATSQIQTATPQSAAATQQSPVATPYRNDSVASPGGNPSTQALAVRPGTPVLASAPHDPAALAAGLKNAVGRSGLFYESHQAQWVAGERPISELMQEPQARLGRSAEPVHPQAVGVVRQQLELLDTRQLVWIGQVWPDQTLEWRIEEERREPNAPQDPARVWKTSLRLTLPRLGAVTATLAVQGDEVRLTFRDLAEATQSVLKGREDALRAAFTRSGLALLDVKLDARET
jgi:hypothetical protein